LALITDIIALIHPASDALGVPLADTVWVLFNQEIDENSINEGNFLIEGPDTDSVIGPGVSFQLPNVSDSGSNDQFSSPGFKGVVPGTISFQKINLSDLNAYTGPADTTGAGNLWRTKAVFTGAFPFQALTQYRVYLAGDENISDSSPTGITTRTIFDTINDPGNTGTGNIVFKGTYIGEITDTYNVEITIDGASGAAWYEWSKDSDPSTIHGPILSDAYVTQILENNVQIKFGTGNFLTGDKFSVIVKPPQTFADNTYWDFNTGSGSIIQPPTDAATSITGDPLTSIQTNFAVTSIVPADRASNLSIDTSKITITFNANIDASTVDANTISIIGQASNGDPRVMQSREIYKDITVTGNKIIITI
jgi:hypothetical protein